jgi:hypothetical protein
MRYFLIVFLCFALSSAAAQKIELNAGSVARINSPIKILLKKPPGHKTYGLYNTLTKNTYPLQWTDSLHALFIFSDSLDAGKKQELQLKKINTLPAAVNIHKSNEGLLVTVKDKPVFLYHTTIAEPPADSPSYYRRSGFIHPLYSPAGKIMTDDFPATHAHQHGIFHAWTNTTFRKQHVDFWNQFQLSGNVRHKEVLSISEGAVYSEIRTTQEYLSLAFGVVLTEEWAIKIYPFADHFLFDLSLVQTNITRDTLFLNEYIYGGMAFRGSREWDPFNKKFFKNNWNILTSEGFRDSSANHTKARWVTAYGMIDGTNCAATVFNYAENFRYPQKIRVHPNLPYWVYAPMVDGSFIIAPGEKYIADYRYFISTGMPDNELLERIHENWINPPEIKFIK